MTRFVLYGTHPDAVTARWRKGAPFRQSDWPMSSTMVSAAVGLNTRATKAKADEGTHLDWLRENCSTAVYYIRSKKPDGFCAELQIADKNEAFAYRMRWT